MSRRETAWTIAAASVLVVGSVLLAMLNPAFAVLIIGAVWLVLPSRPDATPKWLTVLILTITFGSLLPTAVSLAAQGLTLVVGYLLWLGTPKTERRAAGVVGWTSAILGYWAILMLHANIPSLDIALLGFRKTAFCVVGIILGVAIARRYVPAVEQTLIRILVLAVGVSIVLYQFFPGLEKSLVSRSADEYTALIGGVTRLQGVFAGPFHAAVAGLMLVVWGLARFKAHRALALISIAVGVVAVYMTLVRTAYVAAGIAFAFMLLASPTAGKAVRRLLTAAVVGVVAIFALSSFNSQALSIVESISEASTDQRFLGRFPGYAEGLQLFGQSPIFGWGAGAAGDTLGSAFTSGMHITPHNIVLKVAVEGGLIGLFLWGGLVVAMLRRLPRTSPYTAAAVGMLGVVFGMGLTSSSIEALPPTFLIFMYVGLALDPRPAPPQFGVTASAPLAATAGTLRATR